MRVLLIRSDLKLAGPAKLMHAYATALRQRGHEVFFVSGGGAYASTLVEDGFALSEVPDLQVQARRPTSLLATVLSVRGILRRQRIDVINSFNAHAGWIAAAADPLNSRKHFNTVLGTGKESANRLLPGRILAVSGSVKQRLLDAGVKADKIEVVYNATLDERFFSPIGPRPLLDGRGTEPVHLVSVAMFTGQKGHEQILPLVRGLYQDRGRNVRLTLVGDGPTRAACEQAALDLGIADRVTFAGALPDVIPWLDSADIFIHLPAFETFGIVLAEAMARELPVVAADLGGIPEVVEDGKAGVLMPREDSGGLLDAVDRLVSNPALRTTMGKNGRIRAHSLFSLDRLGDSLDALYRA